MEKKKKKERKSKLFVLLFFYVKSPFPVINCLQVIQSSKLTWINVLRQHEQDAFSSNRKIHT